MTLQKVQLGLNGEDVAVDYLKRHGYRIVERNFRNNLGEIDIIAVDGKTICFIEVKTRASIAYGLPVESITPAKQRKIVRVALSYLLQKGKNEAKGRFDVVAITYSGKGCVDVDLIQNAFEAN